MSMTRWVSLAVDRLPSSVPGAAVQRDASAHVGEINDVVISTDPPYYDNICYADLSDFFYVWLRRNMFNVWPNECSTLLTPKVEELVAKPVANWLKETSRGAL